MRFHLREYDVRLQNSSADNGADAPGQFGRHNQLARSQFAHTWRQLAKAHSVACLHIEAFGRMRNFASPRRMVGKYCAITMDSPGALSTTMHSKMKLF